MEKPFLFSAIIVFLRQIIAFFMREENTSIKFWAEDDKPREKLLKKGRSALSDAELIAILISSGSSKETAVELAKRILRSCKDNLIELSKLSVTDLCKFKGIGPAKAISIIAALELGRRRRDSEVIELHQITKSKDIFDLFHSSVADESYEQFWILLLNRANKIIEKYCISEGGLTGTVADPRKIFKRALEKNAVALAICHNHPSGNIQPSDADIKLTRKIKNGAEVMDIQLLDHIIIGNEKYYSFADEGTL
jgi:DNA repair protein RadC